MDGLRVNAKGKQVGFHLVTLKEGSESSQARWLKCFECFCLVELVVSCLRDFECAYVLVLCLMDNVCLAYNNRFVIYR